MPYPQPTSISRPPSIISRSSSLASRSHTIPAQPPAPDSGSGSVYRMSASGLPRQFHKIQRRTRAELGKEGGSSADVASDLGETVEFAGKIFMSDLCCQDVWPSTNEKKEMAREAVNQANAAAPMKGTPQITATKKIMDEVCKPMSAVLATALTDSAPSCSPPPSSLLGKAQGFPHAQQAQVNGYGKTQPVRSPPVCRAEVKDDSSRNRRPYRTSCCEVARE